MYSDEHRAELLERAYRRGNELRLRRRRWLATLAGIVVLVVAGGTAFAVSDRNDNAKLSVGQSSASKTTTSTSANATTCVASISVVPRAKVPHDVAAWAQGAAVVGDGALWTRRSNIDVPGSHQGNIWRVKFSWYTRPFGLPTITGRRLDGTGTFHADANPATDARGTWVVSSFEFSRPGCWQVTSRYRTSTIRFRMHILAPTPSASPSSALPAGQNCLSGTLTRLQRIACLQAELPSTSDLGSGAEQHPTPAQQATLATELLQYDPAEVQQLVSEAEANGNTPTDQALVGTLEYRNACRQTVVAATAAESAPADQVASIVNKIMTPEVARLIARTPAGSNSYQMFERLAQQIIAGEGPTILSQMDTKICPFLGSTKG